MSWGDVSKGIRIYMAASVSGTIITVDTKVGSYQFSWDDNQVLILSGALNASYEYRAKVSTNTTTTLYERTNSFTGVRGATYTVSASLDGTFNGADPRNSVTITVPAIAPSAPGTPTASGITHNATTLAWTAPSNNNGASITRYQIQRATNSSFSDAVSVYTTNRSYTQGSLSGGTTYYWRVRAENSAGWSVWSGTRTTTTFDVPDRAGTATITSITPTTVVFSWTWPNGNGYTPTYMAHQISTNSSFTDIVSEYDDNESPSGPNTLTRATTYYLRLRAKNAAGYGEWGPTVTFKTAATVPDQITTRAIANIGQTTATMTYTAPNNGGSDITGYRIQVSTNSAFTSGVMTFTSASLTGLTPDTTYYARIAAINAVGQGDYSSAVTFKTLSGVRLKMSNVWVWAKIYVKVGGSWRSASVYKKVNGTWRL